MKTPHKTILLSSGIALGVIAVVFGATAGIADKRKNFEATSASQYSLLLNADNSPDNLPDEFTTDNVFTTTSTIRTDLNNPMTFKFVLAKSNSGNFVELAKRGYMYNFSLEDGRITGINAITTVLTSGSLSMKTTNSELSNGGAFLGSATSITSGRYTFDNPVRYFQLQAGDSGAVIKSLLIEYSCSGQPSTIPSGQFYNVEDFQSYTDTGAGWDNNANKDITNTSNLRAEFYSTYHGTYTDPTSGSGWSRMGSTDYITYTSNKGRGNTKAGLFKAGSGNNFTYIQTKAILGINSAIGKGSKLSVWIHGPYTSTAASTNYTYDVPVVLMAFYNAQFNRSGANGASVANYTIASGSDWTNYEVDLDPTKEYYAFGIGFHKTTSGNCYVPVDDVAIYTTSPYPAVSVTGISLSDSSATISINDTKQLSASVVPAYATNKTINWSSSNASVATVTSTGLVTGVSEGNATITASTADGNYSATCAVTVNKVYPGGTYFTTITISSYTMAVDVTLSTRAEAVIYLYGFSAGTCYFESYNESTGAFSIHTDGTAKIGYTTYSFGNMTGYYRNDQLEEVRLTGTIKNLVSGSYTIPHPTSNYWNCNGTTAQLQSTFMRRWRNGSSWSEDASNTDRITAETTRFSSGPSAVAIRPYASGVGLSAKTFFNASGVDTINFWIYNPSQSSVTFRVFLYPNANFDTNKEPTGFTLEAQSWKYYRMGFGTFGISAVHNFMITNLGANSSVTFIVDDIWLH